MTRSLLIFVILAMVIGCAPVQKLKYTIDTPESADQYTNARSEKTIQPYDYLYIKIFSLDDKTSSIFENESKYGMSDEQLLSYEVNGDGNISFPFIGNINLKGLTLEQARNKLESELNKYLTNISVRIRFIGNKIIVLGEVRLPGDHTFYDEKITVFQALGLAGDIAEYGNETKITLIREKDETVTYHYLDLTRKDIVKSDYYYLLPNDIIIVDPVRARYRGMRDYTVLYLLFSTISTVSTAISIYFSLK